MGPVVEDVLRELPIEIIWIDKEPDSKLFKGEPNPLIPERRDDTTKAIKKSDVDFGVSWDGDGDRCFFFDEKGEFIPAPFATALLMEYVAQNSSNKKVIIDLRITWPIRFMADKLGIDLQDCISGRTHLQQALRKEEGYMAAEMTAHYFFKDNYYSDNGIIPLLMMIKLLTGKKEKLSELVRPLREKFFMAEEIKIKTEKAAQITDKLKEKYANGKVDLRDGLSVEFDDWHFNIRGSNTEPVLKLNIESTNESTLNIKKEEVLDLITKNGGLL